MARNPHLSVQHRRAVAIGTVFLLVVAGSVAVARSWSSGDKPTRLVVSTDDGEPRSSSSSASATSLSEPVTAAPSASTVGPSVATVGPDSAPTAPVSTVVLPALALPSADDFSGKLLFYGQVCDTCPYFNIGKNYGLTLRNESDHVFDLSAAASLRVAAICGPNLTPTGQLAYPLTPGSIVAFVEYTTSMSELNGGLLFPGQEASSLIVAYGGESYPPDAPHTGLFTCEGAIVKSDDGSWTPPSIRVVARLTHVATRSVAIGSDYPGASTTTLQTPA
jgi:hypothetical protein